MDELEVRAKVSTLYTRLASVLHWGSANCLCREVEVNNPCAGIQSAHAKLMTIYSHFVLLFSFVSFSQKRFTQPPPS